MELLPYYETDDLDFSTKIVLNKDTSKMFNVVWDQNTFQITVFLFKHFLLILLFSIISNTTFLANEFKVHTLNHNEILSKRATCNILPLVFFIVPYGVLLNDHAGSVKFNYSYNHLTTDDRLWKRWSGMF